MSQSLCTASPKDKNGTKKKIGQPLTAKYLLDSSAWIEYFNSTPKGAKIKSIVEEESISCSIIAIVELAEKFERDEKPFESFLQFIQSRATILPVTIELALAAAKIKKSIRIKNPKFSTADSLHLATARKEGSTFITSDYDFKNIANVIIL